MLTKSGEYLESEVKRKIPLSYESGKSRSEMLQKYDLLASANTKCLEGKLTSESLDEEERNKFQKVELNSLRAENQRLARENEILKQAVLIIG